MLFGLCDAGEGGSDDFGGAFWGYLSRMTGGDGEVVDEFEDEEAGEGAAEVGDAGDIISQSSQKELEMRE